MSEVRRWASTLIDRPQHLRKTERIPVYARPDGDRMILLDLDYINALEAANHDLREALAQVERERDELRSQFPYAQESGHYCDGMTTAWTDVQVNLRALEQANAALRQAREALGVCREHVVELADAWVRGALSEHDGKGGTRSNRNADVRRTIDIALARLSPEPAGRQGETQ